MIMMMIINNDNESWSCRKSNLVINYDFDFKAEIEIDLRDFMKRF